MLTVKFSILKLLATSSILRFPCWRRPTGTDSGWPSVESHEYWPRAITVTLLSMIEYKMALAAGARQARAGVRAEGH